MEKMILKKILNKPFRLMAIIGCLYILITMLLDIFTDFSYEQSIMPFSKTVSYISEVLTFILCSLTFFLYNKHNIYYCALEILTLSNLYNGRIYAALLLTSILFILLLFDNRLASKLRLVIYLSIEFIKLILIIPYGAKNFFEYIGISLFSLCTIGCINLLFRHAYDKKDSAPVKLEDYRLSERQKDCIKEIVVNNTTIKALAINHNVSESAIKKDLSHIYTSLGITGKADLKALFIGYKF
jgi:DNA-binding CsgD family transcriptional regulator